MSFDQHLSSFIQMLTSEKFYSPHTRKNYQKDLQLFMEFLQGLGIKSWQDVDYRTISAFAAQRFRQGKKGNTIQRELSSIRSFYRYLLTQHVVSHNPAKDVKAPKTDKKLPKTWDSEQIEQLLRSSSSDNPIRIRDLAIFELIYSSGLRLAEVVSLNLDDINRSQRQLVVTGKGNKTRYLPIGKKSHQSFKPLAECSPGND